MSHGLLSFLANAFFVYALFYISNTFISNITLKLVKSQAKAKQHSEAELLQLENYSLSSSRFPLKTIGDIFKDVQKASASVLTLYN